ncbi:MAG: sugar phosphate nucleotidyltransferase [Oscillospiraceae bacterium]|nr:sugar phosphate nucleotidyltransferase [Oscillospiraceae bacterium]
MYDLSQVIVHPDMHVIDAMAVINENGKCIAFICENNRLLATVTDGDIRRHILSKGDLNVPVSNVGNYQFKFAKLEHDVEYLEKLRKKQRLTCIPILDDDGRLVDVYFPYECEKKQKHCLDIPVVIMAGGKGTRLAPFTDVLPKPLIPIGDMTITEHIMNRFYNCGCNDFTMIVNYKKELIKAYFSEVLYKGNLLFVDEDEFQGTGGGLKLLEGVFESTFIMTNCDVIVDIDYNELLKHHRNSGAVITLVCAFMKVRVPYGTIELDEKGSPIKLVEKPEYPLLTNTGLYVIEPSFLEEIPSNAFVHITELIQQLIDDGKSVGVYPITENQWSDMGSIEEMEKMRNWISS